MKHLRKLLSERLVTAGVEKSKAMELAGQSICFLLATEVITPAKIQEWERDAQIYYLRGRGVFISDIKKCYAVSRSFVHRCIKRHARRRRAALMAYSDSGMMQPLPLEYGE